MIDRSLTEVRSQLVELKRNLASAVADEQRLYQRYSAASREAERWRQRAELALGKESEELARAALERAGQHDGVAAEHHRQYLEQKGYVERMKIRLLETETRMRAPAAVSPRATNIARLETNLERLERWREREREERARLAAWVELERDELAEKLAAMERESQVEQQLSDLKRKLGRE